MRWLALAALIVGCADPMPPPATSPAPPAASTYSPFGVHLAHEDTQSVSFKDVGLRIEADRRLAVLEAVAEGAALRLDGEAAHHHAWAGSAWHSQCRRAHLYVDLWRSLQPDRLGFSLWRGCSAEDKLLEEEFPIPATAFEGPGWVEHAARLGERVGAAIRRCGAEAC